MLDLSGVPLQAADRREEDPLVMVGGPCVFNPEPVAAFFDFFVIGEGEEVAVETLTCLAAAKDRGLTRAATLDLLSGIQGIYVPAHYDAVFGDDGRFVELVAANPKAKRWVE